MECIPCGMFVVVDPGMGVLMGAEESHSWVETFLEI